MHLAKSMLFFREPGCTKMTEGVALVHQYSVGSWAFLALVFVYQSPWWCFSMPEGWPSSRRVVTLRRLQLHQKKSEWSYALGSQLYQGPEGMQIRWICFDGGGLVDGFAIPKPGAAQSALPWIWEWAPVWYCHCIFCSLFYVEVLSGFCGDRIWIKNCEIRPELGREQHLSIFLLKK